MAHLPPTDGMSPCSVRRIHRIPPFDRSNSLWKRSLLDGDCNNDARTSKRRANAIPSPRGRIVLRLLENSRDWICRTVVPRQKAVLKTRAVQTLRDCRASSNCAERLECGAFTTAFLGDDTRRRIVRRLTEIRATGFTGTKKTAPISEGRLHLSNLFYLPGGVGGAGGFDGASISA